MRPMLAGKPGSLKDLRFPLIGSPKYDGIRALVQDTLLSRRLTPIKNTYLRLTFGRHEFEHMDGELFLPLHLGDFHTGSGIVRSNTCTELESAQVQFHVFDSFASPERPFWRRLEEVQRRLGRLPTGPVQAVPHQHLSDLDELLEYEAGILELDFEGVMLRHPEGPYKFGRSTLNEHWLLKLKRFTDAEAKVIGFKEQLKNNNVAKKDALGKTKRSKHQENMVGKDTLGALEVVGINGRFKGVEFDISGGSKQSKVPFDDALRKEIWQNKKKYLGRTLTYTYFEPGSKDAPRHAGFFRWRNRDD